MAGRAPCSLSGAQVKRSIRHRDLASVATSAIPSMIMSLPQMRPHLLQSHVHGADVHGAASINGAPWPCSRGGAHRVVTSHANARG